MLPPDPPPGPFDDPALAPFERLTRVLGGCERLATDQGGAYDRTLIRLVFLTVMALVLGRPCRALLVGPSGAGKTWLVRTLATALGLPFVEIGLTDFAENTWFGPQLVADGLAPLLWPYSVSMVADQGEFGGLAVESPAPQVVQPRGVVLLDQLQALATTTAEGRRVDRRAAAWRIGRQESLLSLVDAAGSVVVPRDVGRGPLHVHTQALIVLAAGSFGQLDHREPITPAQMVRIGLLPELVDRLGPILSLPSLHAAASATMLAAEDADFVQFCAALGVAPPDVVVPPVTLRDFVGPRGPAYARRTALLDAYAAHILALGREATPPTAEGRDAPPAAAP